MLNEQSQPFLTRLYKFDTLRDPSAKQGKCHTPSKTEHCHKCSILYELLEEYPHIAGEEAEGTP